MSENYSAKQISFRDFLYRENFQRKAILFCFLGLIVQICVFKYYYPFPAFINGDSYVYLNMAYHNLKIDTYPVGYPKFLRLFSVFSSSDSVFVLFQYFFIQIGALIFLFSLFYFYYTRIWVKTLLLMLVSLNPVTLYIANYVSSDALFLALSLFWATSLVWILNRPTGLIIVIHTFILLFAFMVRYNALYYPVISIAFWGVSRVRLGLKIGGVVLIVVVLGFFVGTTAWRYKQFTGVWQFSPFSGWQMANNGMFAYRSVDSAKRVNLPVKFKELDREVRTYFDTTRGVFLEYPENMLDISATYMWSPTSPLRTYMERLYKGDTTISRQKKWASVAPLYSEYGSLLIKKYPFEFLKRYLWPNFIKYYAPPEEFLAAYGFNMDKLDPVAKAWFGYKKDKLYSRFKDDTSVRTLSYYPIVCGMMNAVFLVIGISFIIVDGKKLNRSLFRLWVLFFIIWLFNLLFSVFASPIALRFQIFPLLICVTGNFMLLDFIILQTKNTQNVRLEGREGLS